MYRPCGLIVLEDKAHTEFLLIEGLESPGRVMTPEAWQEFRESLRRKIAQARKAGSPKRPPRAG